jgi:hypothetical protein
MLIGVALVVGDVERNLSRDEAARASIPLFARMADTNSKIVFLILRVTFGNFTLFGKRSFARVRSRFARRSKAEMQTTQTTIPDHQRYAP